MRLNLVDLKNKIEMFEKNEENVDYAVTYKSSPIFYEHDFQFEFHFYSMQIFPGLDAVKLIGKDGSMTFYDVNFADVSNFEKGKASVEFTVRSYFDNSLNSVKIMISNALYN